MPNRRTALLILLGMPMGELAKAALPSPKSKPWDREIIVRVTPAAKRKVISELTSICESADLIRKNAAPGLKELTGREVTFHSFGLSEHPMLITVTDIVRENDLVVSGFYDSAVPLTVERVMETISREAARIPGASVIKDTMRK
jgi:hypothetical protein